MAKYSEIRHEYNTQLVSVYTKFIPRIATACQYPIPSDYPQLFHARATRIKSTGRNVDSHLPIRSKSRSHLDPKPFPQHHLAFFFAVKRAFITLTVYFRDQPHLAQSDPAIGRCP